MQFIQLRILNIFNNNTPVFKQKAIYLFEPIDQFRPELKNYRSMLINNYKSPNNNILLLYPDQGIRPFYSSSVLTETF